MNTNILGLVGGLGFAAVAAAFLSPSGTAAMKPETVAVRLLASVTPSPEGGGARAQAPDDARTERQRPRIELRLTDPIQLPRIVKSEEAWQAQLTPEQYRITRTHGTERAFCGVFHDNHKHGVYACVGCGLPLFQSTAKFDSGTGWPSFFQPIATENIGETRDTSHGMVRIEVHCVRCESHLGHVFPDGPPPTRLRYCINSDSLTFHERPAAAGATEKVLFGAGCFWGGEAAFRKIEGVVNTRVGYAGGHTVKPDYKAVCANGTGHAEVVEVEYDPAVLSFGALLDVFWASHDPFAGLRTGADLGDQYRSAIFFHSPEQEAEARASAARWEARNGVGRSVATEISLAAAFHPAEEYHQRYYEKQGTRQDAGAP